MISTSATTRTDPRPEARPARGLSRWGGLIVVALLVVVMAILLLDRAGHPRGTVEARPVRFDASRFDPAVVRGYLVENGMAGRVRAVVIHFRDGACPCSTLGDARFLALRTRHVGDDVVFATAEAPGGASDPVRGLERLPRLPVEAAARLWAVLPAGPAVAVFDGRGVPLFVGPYAEGVHCSAAHGGRAEAALGSISGGVGSPTAPSDAPGCVCDARARESAASAIRRSAGRA